MFCFLLKKKMVQKIFFEKKIFKQFFKKGKESSDITENNQAAMMSNINTGIFEEKNNDF